MKYRISLFFFDFERIITLDFFIFRQIICLDYFIFISLRHEFTVLASAVPQ